MTDKIDWKALALQLGASEENRDIVGIHHAQHAVELLVGDDHFREAVDYYVSGKAGSELARFFLLLVRPWSAMKYCYELYSISRDLETRRTSVELLRSIGDERALAWVSDFLRDEDSAIQLWGASLFEQSVYSELVDVDEANPLLIELENHANPLVRERGELLRQFLRSLKQPAT